MCLPSGAFWCGVAFPSLRECSRQDYLSKRGLQQIELRKESTDYEALFRGMKVFKRKHKELEFKKDVLCLAEERMNVEDRYDGYSLPEDYITEKVKIDHKKEAVLYQRYKKVKAKDDEFDTDVNQWEAAQTKYSTF